MPRPAPSIAVVCGMDFEARMAEGPGIKVLFGQDRALLASQLENAIADGVSALVSFGTAGGLLPSMRPGDVIIADIVVTPEGRFETDRPWSRLMLSRVSGATSHAVAAVSEPVVTVYGKSQLRETSGAAAVDMESSVIAQAATKHGLPFAVLRVVIDPAERAIPYSALAGVRSDGTTNVAGVVRALARRPSDIGALLSLGRDARQANYALLRSRQSLGAFFGFFDSRELPLDVE